jgi:hypothetical protein
VFATTTDGQTTGFSTSAIGNLIDCAPSFARCSFSKYRILASGSLGRTCTAKTDLEFLS